MRDKLFSFFGIESGEEPMVAMLFTQSVFLGIFFGAFDISAHSLFLSIFDEKIMARGYVVSGIVGILLTSLYTWFQTRKKFKSFAIVNLAVVASITIILWILLMISPSEWVVFIVFIMLGPLNILAMLGFWGTTSRLFTLRQAKRLFGLVDAGLIIGIIVSCYTIPVILSLNFESHNILFISGLSVVIATIFQVMIGSRFSLVQTTNEQHTDKQAGRKSLISVFWEDPYTRIMAIFIAVSVVTAFFVQYSFMAVTREQYPAEEDMARFLGIFTGSMMIFTLLVKLFVFSYLIKNYGLRTCLAVSPILLAIFTVVAILIGSLMGYTPESTGGFLIFFMLLALSRLFSKSLKDSIESPSFKVIYQTLNEKVRYRIQSGMDGTVNEIAALASGLMLAVLGVLSFIKLIHFSLVLFVIIIVWIYVAFKLYMEYRQSIRKALETVDQSQTISDSSQGGIGSSRFSAEIAFEINYYNLVSGDFSSLDEVSNKWYLHKLTDYAGIKNDIAMVPLLKKISGSNKYREEIRGKSSELIMDIEKTFIEDKDARGVGLDIRELFIGQRIPQTTEILRLFRDNSLESKRLAIFLIGKFQLHDMLSEVCECLNIEGLETDAHSVLNSFGHSAVDELMKFYLVSAGNVKISKLILRLLGNDCSEESLSFVFSRLWSSSRQLKEFAIEILIRCDYKPSSEERDKLHQYISDIIGHMTWNLSARRCLYKNNDTYLLDVLQKDINRWNDFLFNTLSIAYDASSITKIRENIENGTVESVNYALEMIDIVIDDSIKSKLVYLIDVVSDEEKLRNLYQFYPGEVPKYDKLIESILNRDYNLISVWTKACVLRSLQSVEGDEMTETVVALLFSPEAILQEEAAKLIYSLSNELYRSVVGRILDSYRMRLDKVVKGEIGSGELFFEKIIFLADCFREIPEEELLPLAASMGFLKDIDINASMFAYDCLIWSLNGNKNDSEETYIYYSDNDFAVWKELIEKGSGGYYVLPLSSVKEYVSQFPERSSVILEYIDNNEA